MNSEKEALESFLNSRRIAVIGLSRNPDDFTHAIYKRLRDSGYTVFGVNPNAESGQTFKINGAEEPFYKSLGEIPGDPIDSAFLTVPPEKALEATRDCIASGIGIIWMHRSIGPGSYSKEAEEYARAQGAIVIPRGCVMMHCQPVDAFHGFFRWWMGCPKTDICRTSENQ